MVRIQGADGAREGEWGRDGRHSHRLDLSQRRANVSDVGCTKAAELPCMIVGEKMLEFLYCWCQGPHWPPREGYEPLLRLIFVNF